MTSLPQEVCQECKGTGEYIGLCEVDTCHECRGTGQRLPRVSVIKNSAATLTIYRMLLEKEGLIVQPYEVQLADEIDPFMEQFDPDVDCIITGQLLQPNIDIVDLLGQFSTRKIDVPVIVSTVLNPHERLKEYGVYAIVAEGGGGGLDATIETTGRAVAASTAYKNGMAFLRRMVSEIARRPRRGRDAIIRMVKRQLTGEATRMGFPDADHALRRFDRLYETATGQRRKVVCN